MSKPYDTLKRTLDVVASLFGLLLTSPIQLALAIAVRLKLGRPILFRQLRPGLHEKPFTLLKFRTMRNPQPGEEVSSATDAARLGKFGRTLRSLSLDELPSLFNILRGDMSIVGPRPLLLDYLPLYTDEQRRRHEVRPGLTGLAQVRGRNALDWESRFAADIEYVENRSLRLDLSIIWRTIVLVFRREGISAPGSATGTRFTGSEEKKSQ